MAVLKGVIKTSFIKKLSYFSTDFDQVCNKIVCKNASFVKHIYFLCAGGNHSFTLKNFDYLKLDLFDMVNRAVINCQYKGFYQSPLILTELFQHNLINVSYLTACYLYQVMMTLHFLNDVANDAESTQK